ncbi:hypothetical protein DFR24_4066 [Panacagrimonas perspica]|uniref:Metal-binding protein n=1 Tax=Panacagrimonas perspica TaxID=381431 RepID=A0A4R7NWM6_9GAMM|nr:hypothetical protein DFR24_4066 [Panacagrimonas perspica]THD03782.1 hypothetical protein B1810_07850 [Panacagrimonas perspica]
MRSRTVRDPAYVSRRVLVAIGAASLLCGGTAGLAIRASHEPGAERIPIVVYRSVTCRCCIAWNEYLERNGFDVDGRVTRDIHQVRRLFGVPKQLRACHTAIVDGYVIEGHVPAADIKRLIKSREPVRGLVVPGMPGASPGMREFSPRRADYDVLAFQPNGETYVYTRHDGSVEP